MKGTGIVGLGAWPLSLVSQLGDRIGHKFSYYLAPIDSNSNSKLKFGDEANILGNGVVSTRLTKNPISPSYYNVNPKGINQIYSSVEAVQDLPQSFDFCGCFKGSSVEVPPEIVFHFNGGDVTLPLENMYTIVENNLVEYDLQGKRVSFAPSNCADNSGLIIISFSNSSNVKFTPNEFTQLSMCL
ncbi:aspartic proteinase CDR1-like [Arachis duranensis]|uniref:Aspartic proteinase CDR1-like n=1 Tax=Arachis duranensis TaxID=130453 RepID=A0A9C6TFD5_ARADU|nr:aspartic proteinase CDR1-like [Arachis duranensis]